MEHFCDSKNTSELLGRVTLVRFSWVFSTAKYPKPD
jgi:hypothetical protein